MRNTIIFTSILLLVIAFTSCTKDQTMDEVSEPSLHIHELVEGATYNAGDTIPVKVHFMDDDELHEYHISVTNTTMTTELLHLSEHTHSTSYEVDTFVIAIASVHSDYEMTAKVSNHNGSEVTETINFHVHP